MTLSPKVFVSFSSRDKNEVRKLFSALHHQKVELWDYSDDGQELPLAHSLELSLKEKIDECDYFIAVISPNSIHEEIGRHTRFEVFYALEKEMWKQNKILPIILRNSSAECSEWLNLYQNLETVVRVEWDFSNDEIFEDELRKMCNWLSVTYIPSSLREKKVFFAERFLEEAETVELSNSDFIRLMKIMDDCAIYILEENWEILV